MVCIGKCIKTRKCGLSSKECFRTQFVESQDRISSSEKTQLSLLTTYINSPKAEDPGGLTIEEVNKDRTQARKANVDYNTTESLIS
jgi:iron complex outermembrane receptor protein